MKLTRTLLSAAALSALFVTSAMAQAGPTAGATPGGTDAAKKASAGGTMTKSGMRKSHSMHHMKKKSMSSGKM